MKCLTLLNSSTVNSPKYLILTPFLFKTATASSQELLLSLYLESAKPLFLLVFAITIDISFNFTGT